MGEWIKCSERLPAKPDASIVFESVDYLVSDGERVRAVRFDRGHGGGKPWASWNTYGDIRPDHITHWQAMPEPPQD
jgi:hypothetical protein